MCGANIYSECVTHYSLIQKMYIQYIKLQKFVMRNVWGKYLVCFDRAFVIVYILYNFCMLLVCYTFTSLKFTVGISVLYL